jgi:uncharacterized membrane protein YfcA
MFSRFTTDPMSFDTTFWLFFAGLAASAAGGMLGMAGGIFVVPALTILFHLGMHTAVGASIVSVIACSCGSASDFLRGGLTNVRLAVVLETGTTLGALTGVLVAGVIPVQALNFLFAVVLLVSAWQMFVRREDPATAVAANARGLAATLGLNTTYRDARLGRDVPYQVHRVPVGLLLMYVAGLISALLGIGSGILKIPAMDNALRLPIKVSTATSNFMIGVTAAASACAYFVRGQIDAAVAGPVALGSVVGAILGARVLMMVPSAHLRFLFLTVLVVVACQMLLQGLDIHPLDQLSSHVVR